MRTKNLLGALAIVAAAYGCASDDSAEGYAPNDPNPNNNNPNNNNNNGNTNVNLGGAQDFGYFRRLLEANIVPRPEQIDASGFFAEHHTPLPQPSCGERVCVQAMLGTMNSLFSGGGCTMLQLGFNSPITIREEDRPPLTLALVIDVSGSMSAAGKMDFVRTGLGLLIDELHDDDRVAMITYSDNARVLFAMADVGPNRGELRRLATGLLPGGSTNISEGLEFGYREVLEDYDITRQNRLIMLSDGEPTAGLTDVQEILDLSRAFNSDGVGLTTIGLGTDFNLELMRGLAEQADGNFYFVEDAPAVEEVFTEEVDYFTVPIAFDIKMQMKPGEQYEFNASYGSSFFKTTADGGELLVPSAFLAHRKAHNDTTPDGGRRGGGSALMIELAPSHPRDEAVSGENSVAVIDFQFREPGTNRIVTDSIDVRVPYSPWQVPEIGFFDNTMVEKSFVVLNIFAAMQSACTLFHVQRGEEASQALRNIIAAARDYNDGLNEGTGDADIVADIELLEQLQLVIERNGAPPARMDPPANPWPRD